MSKNKIENPYEPNPLSLKVTIFVGIVFGFLILTWEIIENIPKYEYIDTNNKRYIFNKINGNLYQLNPNPVNDVTIYNLVSIVSEEKYLNSLKR